MKYDYLIIGSGIYGAVFAERAAADGKKCLILEKRPHIGGNIYTEEIANITVHKYGAHIFHTSDEEVWAYVGGFARFNRFINSPLARFGDKLYSLPFNMNTFYQMWGVITPEEAEAKIAEQTAQYANSSPKNLEEQALRLVGRDIYEKIIKGYTEKQWGRSCAELPAFIIRRLPVRFTFDNNYFSDKYQGIPIGGYTAVIEKMLAGVEVVTDTDFLANRADLAGIAKRVVYTGAIDEYFGYCYGALEYRTLRFETETLATKNYQGNAVVNYNEKEVPYTRIIEHKHFDFGDQPVTVISREYPGKWEKGAEPYYPVNDEKNLALYARYKALAEREDNVVFGGRLAEYEYLDMDKTIARALRRYREQGGSI